MPVSCAPPARVGASGEPPGSFTAQYAQGLATFLNLILDRQSLDHRIPVLGSSPSKLRWNCLFLIFAAGSMPRIVTAAVSNRLNPSIFVNST
jgi:hypothetical protein